MTTTRSAPPAPASGAPSSSYYRYSTGSTVKDGDDHGAHLLRLVLDLQLDALLLGLGAAAVEASRSHATVPAAAPEGSGGAPWPRWAVEDIDLARTLAAETVHSGAALPATLGPEPAAQEEQVVLRRLAARYESMRDLLSDLLARAGRGAHVPGQEHLHALMAHCQNRLAELRTLARTTPVESRTAYSSDHEYLPGELLG